MRKISLLFILLLSLLHAQQESNATKKQKFDIDREIAKIMQAPPDKRRELMNALKRKIFKLHLDIQSSHLIHLQKIMENRIQHRGKH